MLEQLRNAAKTWVAGLFIGLLILSFAVWGINDIFTGTANTDVAKVGDVKISQSRFDGEFRRRIDAISAQTGQAIDTMQARQFGLDQQVLSELVQQTVLSQATDELGLTVSDSALSESIRSDEAFADVLGEFSAQNYAELLSLNNLTPALYEDRVRSDLTRQQLVVSLIAGVEGSQTVAEALHRYREEEREVEYLVISPENAKELPNPTDEELASYHSENQQEFQAPEYRGFTYVLIEPDRFLDEVDVTEEELRGIYDFAGTRFVTPEKRSVRIMTFADEAEAREVHDKIKQGGTLMEVAQENGLNPTEITQTDVTQADLLDSGVAEAVFELTVGTVSNPIDGDLGWAIAEVTSITPKAAQSFDDVREIILTEEKTKRATDLVYDKVGEFQDAFAAGGAIEEAADQIGLKAEKSVPVDERGETKDGKTVPGISDRSGLLRELFTADVGLETDLIDTPNDGFAMLRVDEVIESRTKSLDEVRADVIEAVVSQKRQEKLSSLAAEVADKANAGTPFADLATQYNRSVLKSDNPLKRTSSDELFSSALVAELFTKSTDEFVYGPANFGDSFVVAVTRKVNHPSPTESTQDVGVYEQMLEQGSQSDILEQYLDHLNETLDVKIYQSVIDQSLGISQEN